jgi:hypothetical protein
MTPPDDSQPAGEPNKASAHNGGGNARPHWADRAIAICTGLILLSYITGNYFSCQQLKLTESTLKEVQKGGTDTHELAVQAKNQADRTKDISTHALAQAEATNKLAGEAKRSANLAQAGLSASVDAERPWIGWSDFIVQDFEDGKKATFTLKIKNGGKTPGDIKTVEMVGGDFDIFPENPPYPVPKGPPSRGIVLPGLEVQISWSTTINPTAIERLGASPKMFYVYAHAEYTDVRTRKAHTTHMCHVYLPELKNFYTCKEYNSAN